MLQLQSPRRSKFLAELKLLHVCSVKRPSSHLCTDALICRLICAKKNKWNFLRAHLKRFYKLWRKRNMHDTRLVDVPGLRKDASFSSSDNQIQNVFINLLRHSRRIWDLSTIARMTLCSFSWRWALGIALRYNMERKEIEYFFIIFKFTDKAFQRVSLFPIQNTFSETICHRLVILLCPCK